MRPLVNIHSSGNRVYLFERFGKELVITEDDSTRQFYFEPSDTGSYTAYDGTKLRKIEVANPWDVKKYRSNYSYSSDIPFNKNYLIHHVDTIDKSEFKYLFIDIEILAKEVPNVVTANQPITCVSIYNSHSKDVKTFWIDDYSGTLLQKEKKLFDSMLTYMVQEKPDIIAGWNFANFDFPYMFNRYAVLYGNSKNFSKVISPINDTHSGNSEFNTENPAGVSVMDYMDMFKKVFMREPSYTLDAICQKYLHESSWGTSNFGEITEDIRDKNINDVVRLSKLEDKFKIFDYFDEIRRLTKTEWEDLMMNSVIVENLIMQKARELNIILPNKPKKDENTETTFEGAMRYVTKTGASFNLGKFDLGSAYPNMMVNFCLDSSNIVDDGSGLELNGYQFQQNPNALIPSMVRDMLTLKDALKEEVRQSKQGTAEAETLKIKYNAIKAVANSCFGGMGFSSFRLYDNRIASTITWLVRKLLDYTSNKVKELGYDVIYTDTDSCFITCKDDISDKLNSFVQDWAKGMGKKCIDLKYEYEGYFSKIFIIAMCRYVGHLETNKGTVIETKGAEAKRADSSEYLRDFQPKLIEKILNKENREKIVDWINKEKTNIKTHPIQYISIPCKLPTKTYGGIGKNGRKMPIPIFVRAINNTNSFKKMTVPVGEVIWWAYVKPKHKDANGKDIDVLAFTKDDQDVINAHKVDYERMCERNITNKVESIFEAQGWSTLDLTNKIGQMQLL